MECPDKAYCDKFYNMTIELINKYDPSLIYFDDTYLPLYPISDAGLKIAAHMYNKSIAENRGKNESVICGKVLNDEQKKTIVWDVERGAPDKIQELPWQTCTCIGQWHYDKHVYYNDQYKSATQVIQMLVDVVSKNGNLLLSIPVKGNGTIDPTEERVVGEIGAWIKVNGESIYGTRPWVVYSEGPSVGSANPIRAQGFNEGRVKMISNDIRFNQKGKVLYLTVLGVPTESVLVKSLGKNSQVFKGRIRGVELLGSKEELTWKQEQDASVIQRPSEFPTSEAVVFKVLL